MGLYANRKAAGKCVQCGCRPPEPEKTRCAICSKKKAEKQQRQAEDNSACGLCACGKPRDSERLRCVRCRKNSAKQSAAFRQRNSTYNRNYMREIFLEALKAYGGPTCVCCGESNIFFLTLDHVNNDGAEHRRRTKGASGKTLAWVLKKEGYPPGIQVLCFNCNCGRARNGGICPHRGGTKWLS